MLKKDPYLGNIPSYRNDLLDDSPIRGENIPELIY